MLAEWTNTLLVYIIESLPALVSSLMVNCLIIKFLWKCFPLYREARGRVQSFRQAFHYNFIQFVNNKFIGLCSSFSLAKLSSSSSSSLSTSLNWKTHFSSKHSIHRSHGLRYAFVAGELICRFLLGRVEKCNRLWNYNQKQLLLNHSWNFLQYWVQNFLFFVLLLMFWE